MDELRRRARILSQEVMPDREFNELLDILGDKVREQLDGKRTRVAPTFIVFLDKDDNGKRPFIYCPMSNLWEQEERHDAFRQLGGETYSRGFRPVAAFLAAEAWLSTQHVPSRDPSRVETVLVAGCTIDGRGNLFTLMVDREPSGAIVPSGSLIIHYDEHETQQPNHLVAEFFAGYMDAMGMEMGLFQAN